MGKVKRIKSTKCSISRVMPEVPRHSKEKFPIRTENVLSTKHAHGIVWMLMPKHLLISGLSSHWQGWQTSSLVASVPSPVPGGFPVSPAPEAVSQGRLTGGEEGDLTKGDWLTTNYCCYYRCAGEETGAGFRSGCPAVKGLSVAEHVLRAGPV